MNGDRPRTRLEQLVLTRGLRTEQFLGEFARRANELDVEATLSRSALKRWLQGSSGLPRPPARRVLEVWFGEPCTTLFGPPCDSRPRPVTERELAVNAAHDSVIHAIEAASSLDPSALEHLRAAADRLTRAYLITPSLEILSDLITLRDTIYEQLQRTHKPLQQADLYLLAGQVCGLLSSVTWDLGLVGAAQEQAGAAYTYGRVIDHPSLQAWARALQTTFAFWSGEAREAARVAAAALATAPAGTARARLHSVNARSLAMLGARGEVELELRRATDELNRAGDDPWLDEVGGELAFSRARRGLCAGAAFVTLGDGEQAESEAAAAVDLFAEQPVRERWQAGAIGAQVDLSAARTLRGDLAGATAALDPVLELDPARRTEAIALRLNDLAKTLRTASFRGAREALELTEAIEVFNANSLSQTTPVRELPPSS